MSALAQSREVMVRFCVMYKTPFCVFHYHLLSLLLMNRQSAPESLRLFVCVKKHIEFHLKRDLRDCSSKFFYGFVNGNSLGFKQFL
jgi:hypothetical protein